MASTTDEFRMGPLERVVGPEGRPMTIQICEEYDPESGRWEPFVSIVSEGRGRNRRTPGVRPRRPRRCADSGRAGRVLDRGRAR